MEVTIKQNEKEQAETRAELDRALLPFKLDWNDVPSMNMLGSYIIKHHTENGVMDCSFGIVYKAIKELKQHLAWIGDAPRTAPKVLVDERGQIIRDRRQERKDEAKRQAEEAKQSRNNRTFEGELKAAETRAAVNRTIEATREEIKSFRGSSHSKTYAVREKATEILDKAIQNDRTLGGIASAASDIRLLMRKAWD